MMSRLDGSASVKRTSSMRESSARSSGGGTRFAGSGGGAGFFGSSFFGSSRASRSPCAGFIVATSFAIATARGKNPFSA